jgi:hypothetical protein
MKSTEAWKNFNLGQELSVSGAFIYNGLRRFHEMRVLDNTDEIFEVLYNLSVGLERLLKIAVVLLEHNETTNQDKLEKSLRTHNHLDLLQRVTKHTQINLDVPDKEFLALLGTFYKTLRYDRFTISSVYDPDKERDEICRFLGKHLQVNLERSSSMFPTHNDVRYREFLRKLVTKISIALYDVVRETASDLNLYTYELRDGSRAQTIFLGQANLPSEEVLWKELLVFFMNTDSSSGLLEFLRTIDPLEFDPELANEYLECFQSDTAKAFVVGELEALYDELTDSAARLETMKLIGNPNVCFDSPDLEEEEPPS